MIGRDALLVSVDGHAMSVAVAKAQPLAGAVINSLFSWARARPDDPLPGGHRYGWWGDTYPIASGDRYGSRLWLLAREKVTPQTIERAREYGAEALAWLIDDGVAARVDVSAERHGVDGIALGCRITRTDGRSTELRFASAWEYLRAL